MKFTVTGTSIAGIPFEGEFETDDNGVIEITELPDGEYRVKEIASELTEGYVLSDEQTATIAADEITEMTIENKQIRGNIQIIKTDKATGKPLAGAVFGLFKDGAQIMEATTDENGIAEFSDIPYGDYEIRELSAPEGYKRIEKAFAVSVHENGETVKDLKDTRVAEDVDETALSYAEIKALATGNPLIIEKCQLEMDVNKLKILQASLLSQKYALEDKILKEYPQAIKRQTERIAGYKADMETVAKHPADKDHFPPMKVGGILYAEKADAGKAIIEACKAMTSPDPVAMGEYRGFQMILSFDSFSKEYRVTLSGALSHTVKLGTDIHGNITRLDNALEGFASSLLNYENSLSDTQTQLKSAQGEVLRPFPQEQEYLTKSARLREVNSMLNMDEKDSAILDFAPDEGETEPPPKVAGMER